MVRVCTPTLNLLIISDQSLLWSEFVGSEFVESEFAKSEFVMVRVVQLP
jgi:hypothetical protein